MAGNSDKDILGLTARIVSAHIANNHIAADLLPELIQSVYSALATAGTSEPAPAPLIPAAPIRQSVFPAYIVCLEDGKKMKILKRHLQTSHGMTPKEYRQKWGLPASYPMAAPNYTSFRLSLAKQTGLGQRPANLPETSQDPDPPAEPPVTRVPARHARGSRG